MAPLTTEEAMQALTKHLPINRAQARLTNLENDGIRVPAFHYSLLNVRKKVRAALTKSPYEIVMEAYQPDPLITVRPEMQYTASKVCSLMVDAGILGKMSITEMQERLVAHMQEQDGILLVPNGHTIHNGNTRFVLSKLLGIPDDRIPVRKVGDDSDMTLATYRKLFD